MVKEDSGARWIREKAEKLERLSRGGKLFTRWYDALSREDQDAVDEWQRDRDGELAQKMYDAAAIFGAGR